MPKFEDVKDYATGKAGWRRWKRARERLKKKKKKLDEKYKAAETFLSEAMEELKRKKGGK